MSSSTNAKGAFLDRKHRKGLQKNPPKNKVNGNGILLINNYLKCKWVKCSNQKTKTGQMDKKIRPLYMLSTRDPPQNTYRLEVKGWRKIFHANRDQKKAGVAILISDKINKDCIKRQRTLHNDQGINPRRRYNNY